MEQKIFKQAKTRNDFRKQGRTFPLIEHDYHRPEISSGNQTNHIFRIKIFSEKKQAGLEKRSRFERNG